MNPIDLHDRVHAEAAVQHRPEAVSVLVLSDDEPMARLVGPLLAERLYPGRRFGGVLPVDPDPEMRGLLVAVEVR